MYALGQKHKTDKIYHHGYHRFYEDFLNKYRSAGIIIENFLDNPNFSVSKNPNGTLSKITANSRT